MSDYNPGEQGWFLQSWPDNSFTNWADWAEFVPAALYIKDLQGRYKACNRAFEQLTGMDRRQLVGCTVFDLEQVTDAQLHREMDRQLLATGQPQVYETFIRCAPRGVIYGQLTKALLRDAQGEVTGIIGVIADLGPQRKMALELRLREAAIAATYNPLALVDLQGRLLYVNQAFASAMQVSDKNQLLGTYVEDLGVKQERLQQIIATIESAGLWEEELSTQGPDGQRRSWRVRTHLVPAGEGHAQCVLVDFEEITQTLAVEEKLRQREALYRELVEGANSIILRLDTAGCITFLNEYGERFFGYSQSELSGRPAIGTIIPHFDSQGYDLKAMLRDLLQRPELYANTESENISRDGQRFWVSWTHRPLRDEQGRLTGILAIGNDLTARRQLEMQLRIHRAAVESSVTGIGLSTLEGRITYANRAYLKLWGYDHPAEVIGRHISEFMPSDEAPEVIEALEEQGRWQGEREARRRDGSTFKIQISANVVHDEHDQPISLMGSFVDVTAQVAAETELRQFRTISDNANYGAAIIDMENRISYVNEAFAQMHGYSREELVGQIIFHLHYPDQMARISELGKKLRRGGVVGATELMRRRKDGSTFPALMNVHLVRDESGQPLFRAATVIDITEQQQLQQAAFRAQKLESLGVLAGGIAHDFNNLLTAVMGHLGLARIGLEPSDPRAIELADAEKAALLAKNLTGQLLTFAQGGEPVKRVLALGGVLADVVTLATSGSPVQAQVEVPADLWAIEGDRGQLLQVFNNLLLNAVQASAFGQVVQVQARNRWVMAEENQTLEPGPYVQVTVQDQGSGIAASDLTRIFDPYYTTKADGHGLGLTIAYAIIIRHQGLLEVDSNAAQGTQFTVLLPSTGIVPPPDLTAVEQIPAGKGRILVMDDDPLVRRVALATLKHLGYEPTTVTKGEEALAAYRQAQAEGRPFTVVILDLTIRGGQGGVQTLQALREVDPQVKALACSGYSTDPVMAEWTTYGFAGVVVKPYRMAELSAALGKLAGNSARSSDDCNLTESPPADSTTNEDRAGGRDGGGE